MKDPLEELVAAIPWRCFHCDFITMDRAEAAAHFGDSDDASEFVPICKWWRSLTEDEKLITLQSTLRDLNSERDANQHLSMKIETLEYQVESQEDCMKSYKPFKHCRSIHDIFCLYDSMEGRALAAEQKCSSIT